MAAIFPLKLSLIKNYLQSRQQCQNNISDGHLFPINLDQYRVSYVSACDQVILNKYGDLHRSGWS